MTEIPESADQKAVNAVVNALDPVTLWRWKKAIEARERNTRTMVGCLCLVDGTAQDM